VGALIRVLGPVDVVTDAGPECLPPLERALIAVLAANVGRLVTADRLIDALWGQEAPVSARNRVQALVSALRRVLRDDVIVTRPSGYLLRLGDAQLDAARFERLIRESRDLSGVDTAAAAASLREALALWRGHAFEDVRCAHLAAEVVRLGELRRVAVEELMAERLSLGEHADLVAELSALVVADPLRDRLRGQLMVALHRCGRQAEALDVYRRGAQALADAHGLDPPEELRRLRDAILLDDTALTAPPPGGRPETACGGRPEAARGAVPELGVTPGAAVNQLPATIPDFVGRAKELQHLKTVLTQRPALAGAGVVVSVAGMPGSGKTALAVRVGHELQEDFAAGCLYADLRGADPRPANPLKVLGSFLRACGVSNDAIPADVDGRAGLFRSVLSGRRMLVVLDDAYDESQVRPLIPGAGAAVLVTSRRPLAGLAGAELIRLDTLTDSDGLDLLARVAGPHRLAQEPAAAERVVALCGRLPLALRVAGVRLALQDSMTITWLDRQLADERQRLDQLSVADLDVRASIEISYRRLAPEEAEALGLLCLLPSASFAPWLAAALVEAPLRVAERLLERLQQAQLVSAAGGNRYRLHDLIRLHGQERTGAAAGMAAVEQAYAAMVERARYANSRLPCRPLPVPPAGADFEDVGVDPVAWFEAEHEGFASAVEHAVDIGRHDLAAGLATATANFLMMRGYVDDWQHGHRLVLDAVRAGRAELDPGAEAALLLGYGTLLRFSDRNREALSQLRRAYRLYERAGDSLGAAAAALTWGIAARMLGRPHAAGVALSAATRLTAAHAVPTPLDGYVHLAEHHLAAVPTTDRLERALAVFDRLGERWGAAEAHSLAATVLRREGRIAEAVVQTRAAIDTYAQLGDRVNGNVCELMLARLHLDGGDTASARSILHRARRVSAELRHPWGEAMSLQLLGRLHLAGRRPAEALAVLDQAVGRLRRLGNPASTARALSLLGQARLACGDRAGAVAAGTEARAVLVRLSPGDAPEVSAWLSALDTST
jgi:DNA-binding SARP family transcriptional activator/tetratricopeptide (TPR) repeat protein